MKRIVAISALLLAAAFLAVNCGKANPVVGTWEIIEYSFAGDPNPAMLGKTTTFDKDGAVSGFVGTGTYTLAGDKVICKVKRGVDIEVTMLLKDGKLVVETPAVKIVYRKK